MKDTMFPSTRRLIDFATVLPDEAPMTKGIP